jgi:hypothetical protein
MKLPAALNELLQKPMDRKEFLKHTAAMTLFVAGGGMLTQSLVKGMKIGSDSVSVAGPAGYGASVYGGANALGSPK